MKTILVYVYYPVALVLAALTLVNAAEAERLLRLAAEMQSPSGATRMAWAALLERLSFSWYSGGSDLADAYARVVTRASAANARAGAAAVAMGCGAVLHLAALNALSPARSVTFARHLNLLALLAFAIGIWAPMLTIIAHAEVPVLGQVYLRYESKSILSAVGTLVSAGDWLLAVVIGAFSIALPLAKVALVGVMTASVQPTLRARCAGALHALGKWSMADVFVVAVLVAYLAAETEPNSSAEVGLGLYFFTAYCLLSMVAAGRAARGAGEADA